ncbi:medium-chain acyl-CoA ligase ACSF2, mitochondrial-like [Mercenaria mercenaria]|uniref:medium-chain acyl-CoA ligase ACSF2, mitochondrial-like n=1 Tax=Mercenaria mercenaria TaxID=6596 RepID=UPI00234E6DB8|nr:medium-chain acyl-CoA ligase ACSF2, mitochondrial-like [Mercenaria mercenaria]
MDGTYVKSHVKIENYLKEIRTKNIKQCLQGYAKTKSKIEAFVFVSTNGERQSISWANLYERSCATASSMIRLGVKRNEIVAISLRTCPEWLYATFGAMIAGAIPVSVAFTYTDGSDLVAIMERMKCCSLFIMDPGFDNVNWNIAQGLLDEYNDIGDVKSAKLPYLRYLVGVGFENCSDPVKHFQDLLNGTDSDADFPDLESGDVATMLQTSGSTGVSKLVVHTHASLISLTGSEFIFVDPNYIVFNGRPFNWIGGFPLSILTGESRVTISGFCEAPTDRVSFMKDIIEKERCSLIYALPPLMVELIRMLHSLVANSESFVEYGCGTPLPLQGPEMKIVDEYGQTLPVETRGEIYSRSPGMFKEYFHDQEKTKAVMTGDGWYKTDDIGRMTEKGEFFVEGRKSNIIISGGMTISPEILEQVMKTFPEVESVVMVPVPDEVYYQVVCACIVLKAGSDITEPQLRMQCHNLYTDKTGLFTVLPTFYLFLEKIPETKTGKIDRKGLERLACSKFR